jgi:DNA (cytosine-5)-methyltransferase 1
MKLRVLDLFAGAGGISEGLRSSGFKIVGGSDIDPDAVATYRANFPEALAVCGDIRDDAVRRALLEVAGEIDVLVGGPPCQAFSQVRNHARLLDDPRNSLYREFITVLGELLPLAFIVENVPGMDQMGVREQIATDLSLHGEYDVLPQIVNSADFGVPQTRNRLVFLGIRRTVGTAPTVEGIGIVGAVALNRSVLSDEIRYRLKPMADASTELAAVLRDCSDLRATTAAQAISDLVGLAPGNRHDELTYSSLGKPASAYQRLMRDGAGETIFNVQIPRMNVDTAQRLDGVPAGGNHVDLAEALKARYLSGHRWGPDSGSGRLARKHYYAYRRLHPDIWSWTLNTKADAVYHYNRLRGLSVREFARLHSFPDRFVFKTDGRKGDIAGRIKGGPSHSRYRQVGNAVPPMLAAALGDAISKALLEGTR